MRTFYAFKINREFSILMKKNPYHLFSTLESIYHLDKQEWQLGMDLFHYLITPFNPKELDVHIFKNYKNNYFYTKFKNVHRMNNIYKEEETKLVVNKTYLLIRSTIERPSFLKILAKEKNLFLCDFENKDYFWLDSLFV